MNKVKMVRALVDLKYGYIYYGSQKLFCWNIILRVETFVSWTIGGLKDFAKKKHHENYGL